MKKFIYKKLKDLQNQEDIIIINENELEETINYLFSYFNNYIEGYIEKEKIEGMIIKDNGEPYEIWITDSPLHFDLNTYYCKVYDRYNNLKEEL